MPRVKFSVSNSEWKILEEEARKKGYPSIASYCKNILLKTLTYSELWNQIKSQIKDMESGTEFALRDLKPTSPSGLGIPLYKEQHNLGIVKVGKDSWNSNVYKKL